MPSTEFVHLELLAEIDSLVGELSSWTAGAPDWPPARRAKAVVRRLTDQADAMRVRLDAPLVVATLGGTGTGKSSLVNALVGAEVTLPGRQRPTTRQPILVCRPDITPRQLGIAPASVHVVERDLPALRDWVLVDCPDPDTTEATDAPGTNLARLRALLPHCDVLLVTTTQQKYRSARVADELAAAAAGARLVFVQTHADTDEDIRDDWRRVLSDDYAAGEMFFVDSPTALADAQAGLQPRGEFGRLAEFLSRELAGTAAKRIRRANFLDLAEETLTAYGESIADGLPAVEQLEAAVVEQRGRLAARLASQVRGELLNSRRPWESRLLAEIASRWGFSPFACLLRLYQGLGGLLSGAALWRVRTPAQLALWGVWEGGRRWQQRRRQQRAESAAARAAAFGFGETELRTAAIIIEGYAAEAGLRVEEAQLDVVEREAAGAGESLAADASGELQSLVGRLARRHTGWFVRCRYELALLALLVPLLYRFGRNFFYDSWLAAELGLAAERQPLLGADFFLGAGFWLLVWCGLLLWAFTSRLRRGVTGEIEELVQGWNSPKVVAAVFAGLERRCREVHRFRHELERLQNRVGNLRHRVTEPEPRLGRRIA